MHNCRGSRRYLMRLWHLPHAESLDTSIICSPHISHHAVKYITTEDSDAIRWGCGTYLVLSHTLSLHALSRSISPRKRRRFSCTIHQHWIPKPCLHSCAPKQVSQHWIPEGLPALLCTQTGQFHGHAFFFFWPFPNKAGSTGHSS
jgi:hypothetical protein